MKTTRTGYTVARRYDGPLTLWTYHITITPKRAAVREVYPNGRVSGHAGHYDPQTIDRRYATTIPEAWARYRDDTQRLLEMRQAEVQQLQDTLQQAAFHIAQLPADDPIGPRCRTCDGGGLEEGTDQCFTCIEDEQKAHRQADPHCTCNDCMADFNEENFGAIGRALKGKGEDHGPLIRDMRGLLRYFGAEGPRFLNHRLYKDTECGASISVQLQDGTWVHNGSPQWDRMDDTEKIRAFTVQTIVEGSEATVDSQPFVLPCTQAEVTTWIAEMEAQADDLWRQANEATEGEDHED